ncbi:MAG TPA: hypothetical protein VKA77_06035, partial [Mycobacterium sp.]|nr:hypothetical protein [Mycobacterium sp.]
MTGVRVTPISGAFVGRDRTVGSFLFGAVLTGAAVSGGGGGGGGGAESDGSGAALVPRGSALVGAVGATDDDVTLSTVPS